MAILLWRDLPADRVAYRSIQPDTLNRAHWGRRRGDVWVASIEAVRRGRVNRMASVQQVIVDATVMPKAVAHPLTAGCWTKEQGRRGQRATGTADLQPRGTAVGRASRALRARQVVQAHE